MRRLSLPAVLVILALAIAAAPASALEPFEAPGETDRIEFVSSTDSDGFHWDFFRNLAYPCSISGYQTFAVGTRIGTDPAEPHPLWVRMRGGGVGYFNAEGKPEPTAGNKSENGFETLLNFAEENELNDLVNADPSGFRNLSVSMCNHDIYGGGVQPDPNNPNLTPDGQPRTVNGLFATKAAIRFVQDNYATSRTFLHGTSAGSFGSWGVAWSLQEEDRPAAGFVADSGVINAQYEQDLDAQGAECARGPVALAAIQERLHPELTDPANQPDQLLANRELTTPVFNVYSRDDRNSCGEEQVACTAPDGVAFTTGSMQCKMARVNAAIGALPASAGSRTAELCVAAQNQPEGDCERHVVTNVKTGQFPNTNPQYPADHNAMIMEWVRERLGDPPPELHVSPAKGKNLRAKRGRGKVECLAGGVEERTCRVQFRERTSAKKSRRIGDGEATLKPGADSASAKFNLSKQGRKALAKAPKKGLDILVRTKVTEEFTDREGESEKRYRLKP